MRRVFLNSWLFGLILLAAVAIGCNQKPLLPPTDDAMPVVNVSKPVEREVTDYVDFTGRIEAPFYWEARARVTGYLVAMPFKEGSLVKKDEILFEIDDRPYKDDLDKAKGEVERNKASLVKAQADLDIALETAKLNPGAVSKQEIAKRTGTRDEAAGALKVAEATEARAQLNYDWCKVRTPIDGQVSRYNLTLGNLATQDTTVLTTVVSQDPIYGTFDVDEQTMLQVLRRIMPRKVNPLLDKGVPVYLAVADEEGFPHEGHVNFANNVVSASTGTISVRGVFANPAGPSGHRLLRPGMFVRIRLPLGQPYRAPLVADAAIANDQAKKNLFVVDSENKVRYQPVTLGPLQEDGLRVIKEGLKGDERVVVSGLQLVRPNMKVEVEEIAMPVQKTTTTKNTKSTKEEKK
jgi:multidrug efflux system membrane fusion protein